MSRSTEETLIDAYVRRLSELQDADETTTQADLDAIAIELGLTEADLATARETAQVHADKGDSYSQYEQWDEAIAELTQALTLCPLNPDYIFALAAAYSGRYQQHGRKADREQAMALAQQCLKFRPNDLRVLKITGQTLPNPQPFRRRHKRLALVLGTALGAVLIGLDRAGIVDVNQLLGNPAPPSTIESAAVEDEDTLANLGTPVADRSAAQEAEVDIPILYDDATLVIDPRLSRLSNYDQRSFYKLRGALVNQSQTELVALNLKVEYLDAEDRVMAEESQAVLSDSDAPLRPGDTYPVSLIEELSPKLAAVRLTVLTRDQLPAPASYEPSPTVNYAWAITPPANLSVDITARRDQFDSYTSAAYHDAVFAFTNTGEVAIQQLKLQIEFFDEREKRIGEATIPAIYGDDVPLLPGETRPVRSIKSVPETYASYRLTVIEAE
ncbi:MAG: hypothetical protein AAFY78_19705 [Cyanobacteria bacterium J06648_16]